MRQPNKRRTATEIGTELDEALAELATQVEREREASHQATDHRNRANTERKRIDRLKAELEETLNARASA